MVAAASHPLVDVIGHPTGRHLIDRRPTAIDVAALIAACAEHGTFLEINSNPERLDLSAANARAAREAGVPLVIYDRRPPHRHARQHPLRRHGRPPRLGEAGRRRQHPCVGRGPGDAQARAADMSDFPAELLAQWEATAARRQMSLDQAMAAQFRLVDIAQRVMGSDEVFAADYGQVRDLATVGFGGGGRPRATARVEEVLARFFESEDAVLVHGAGSGAIRAMLNASAAPGRGILLHDAHPYKTTLPAMEHMGLDIAFADCNDAAALERSLRRQPAGDGLPPARAAAARRPLRPGRDDPADPGRRDRAGADRRRRQLRGTAGGADRRAAGSRRLGAVALQAARARSGRRGAGPAETTERIRRDLSSAGVQVQGPAGDGGAARAGLRASRACGAGRGGRRDRGAINERIAAGALPYVARAFAAQPGVRCAVVVFDRPVAEEFLQSAWRNGSPSQSVGEESQYEFLPLFTYLASTFLKATPELQRWAIRINPLRGGPDTDPPRARGRAGRLRLPLGRRSQRRWVDLACLTATRPVR